MIKCNSCGSSYENYINFCPNCGIKIEKRIIKNTVLNNIIGFYSSIIIYLCITYFVFEKYPENLTIDIFMEIIFIFIVVGFCLYDFKNIRSLFSFPKLKQKSFIALLLIPILTACLVSFGMDYLNDFLFDEKGNNYYDMYSYVKQPLLWSIIFIAILPPIFEELAFRGVLFNYLSKITSIQYTIIATSFLFALIHFSFIAMIWIFPFGLFLGYLRNKYNSLWLPMLVHFMHNFIVILLDYYTSSYTF